MSLASTAGRIVLRYLGTTAGYDATKTRLIDQESNGLHAPLLVGSPTFAARSGATTLSMHGDVYFGPPLVNGQPVMPIPTRFTAIAVVWPFLAATDNFDFMMGVERDYAGTDPAWQTPTTTFENSAAYNRGIRMHAGGNGNGASGGSATYPANTTFTPSAWNVMQLVADPDNSQFRFRVGQGSWVTAATSAGQQMQALDDWRLGYKAATIDLTGGHDFAMAQLMIFNGLPATDNDTAYEAMITTLMANPLAT